MRIKCSELSLETTNPRYPLKEDLPRFFYRYSTGFLRVSRNKRIIRQVCGQHVQPEKVIVLLRDCWLLGSISWTHFRPLLWTTNSTINNTNTPCTTLTTLISLNVGISLKTSPLTASVNSQIWISSQPLNLSSRIASNSSPAQSVCFVSVQPSFTCPSLGQYIPNMTNWRLAPSTLALGCVH